MSHDLASMRQDAAALTDNIRRCTERLGLLTDAIAALERLEAAQPDPTEPKTPYSGARPTTAGPTAAWPPFAPPPDERSEPPWAEYTPPPPPRPLPPIARVAATKAPPNRIEPTAEQRLLALAAWTRREPVRLVMRALGTTSCPAMERVRREDHWPERRRVVEGFDDHEYDRGRRRDEAPEPGDDEGEERDEGLERGPNEARPRDEGHAPVTLASFPIKPTGGSHTKPRRGTRSYAPASAGKEPVDEDNLPPRRCQACQQVTTKDPCQACGKPL